MESIANSMEDYLVDGLSFKLTPGASYINERKSVTWHPMGSNIYSSNGTKLIKLLVTGDSWLDPSTFRVMFDVVNTESSGNRELRVLGGPWTFFKRMRVLCNGTIVEDIDDYARVHEMFSILTSKDSRDNVNAEAFGQSWDIRDGVYEEINADNFGGIKAGQSQTVLFKPLSGLLAQSKFLPLRYCPLTIELELTSDSYSPIISAFNPNPPDVSEGGPNLFNVQNTGVIWQIQNVQAKGDICVLDNSLENSYTEHLLSGKSLPINYNTYISQIQSILSGATGQKKVRLNITRSLTRLKSVFISFDREVYNELSYSYAGRKAWNDFYSPMHPYNSSGGRLYDTRGEFEAQIQLGSKLYPEYPIRSHAEGFYQLSKTLGNQASKYNSFDITANEYRDYKFILGFDMERVIDAGFTGMNTRAGDILNIRFDHQDTTVASYATSMHICLHSDNIMEIMASGIQVHD
jgi:hypothetical protein